MHRELDSTRMKHMEKEYSNNITVKLHLLHQELDSTRMKHGERIEDYNTRVLDIVYQIRMLGEEFAEKTVVTKILRSLTTCFTNVVWSIVEAKNLNTLIVNERCSSLKSHESILNIIGDLDEERALHVIKIYTIQRTTIQGMKRSWSHWFLQGQRERSWAQKNCKPHSPH